MRWLKFSIVTTLIIIFLVGLGLPFISNYQILRLRPVFGYLRLSSDWICRAFEEPGRTLCFEGIVQSTADRDFQKYSTSSMALVQNLSRFSFRSNDYLPFWAVAFGASAYRSHVNINDLLLAIPLDDPRIAKYLVDGWAIEQTLSVGGHVALSSCRIHLGPKYDKICRWSCGRARYFRPENGCNLDDPLARAGYDFAVSFLEGGNDGRTSPGGKMALTVREIMSGIAIREFADCLGKQHMSECLGN